MIPGHYHPEFSCLAYILCPVLVTFSLAEINTGLKQLKDGRAHFGSLFEDTAYHQGQWHDRECDAVGYTAAAVVKQGDE